MKKILFVLLAFSTALSAQESVLDSLEVQNLEEVIVSSVRVKDNIPIAFNNVSKEEISKRNLGQDIPILLNFLPNDSFFCFDRLLIETNFAFSTSWIASANFCAIFPRPKIPHLITILFTFLNI